MSQVRRYVMPGDKDERARLVDELKRMAEEVLGYPARDPVVAGWSQRSTTDLRKCHEAWEACIANRRPVAKESTEKPVAVEL